MGQRSCALEWRSGGGDTEEPSGDIDHDLERGGVRCGLRGACGLLASCAPAGLHPTSLGLHLQDSDVTASSLTDWKA